MKTKYIILAFLFPLVAHSKNEVLYAELQWPICEDSIEVFFNKLNQPADDYEARKVYFTDTQELELLNLAVVLRTRVSGGKIKTSNKINYPDDKNIPWELFAGQDFKCEEDFFGYKSKIGCTIKSKGKDILTDEQKLIIETERGFSSWEKLKTLGPADSLEWTISDLGHEFTIELIQYKNKFQSIEISTRVDRKQRSETFQKISDWLKEKEIITCERSTSPQALIKLLAAENN